VSATVRLIENDKRQTFFSDAWLRLKQNKLAIAGLVMILLLFFVAIFAPLLAPYDPIKQD
jgi:peptide/nickel transport system permease protein